MSPRARRSPSQFTLKLLPIGSELADIMAGPSHYDLLTYPADFTLELLDQKLRSGDIEIPVLQRRFIWTIAQSSRLIESFLLGLPVPPVFLYAESPSEKLLVVDGQQRLRSITDFFKGAFREERASVGSSPFRLKLDKGSKWNERSFSDLSLEDSRRLKNSVMRALIMKQVSPKDNTSIYHVFERLNTGGTSLTNQEVRNCVYEGPFNALLHKLNEHNTWRAILGSQIPESRLRDIELILRFLALNSGEQIYQKPMKDFLSTFMFNNKNGKFNPIYEVSFTSVCDRVVSALGNKPFHVRAGLNAAIFDSVFVSFARNQGGDPSDLQLRYNALLADREFKLATSSATTDDDNVHERIRIATTKLFG